MDHVREHGHNWNVSPDLCSIGYKGSLPPKKSHNKIWIKDTEAENHPVSIYRGIILHIEKLDGTGGNGNRRSRSNNV